MNHQDLPVVLHNDKRGLLTIENGRFDVLQLSRDGRPPKRLLSSSVRNLLRVRLAGNVHEMGQQRRLDIHTLIQKGRYLRLSQMHVLVEPINGPEAEQWVDLAMLAAYGDIKPMRRVLLLVNPVGGKGKGKSIVKESALPILEAAGCVLDVRETTHRSHAEEIAKEVALDYDVIATASGDGLVYEVINGLAARPDARKALRIPVAPIPTGSANALCTNLFGVKDTFNVPLACLNIIKGRNLPLDLCSVLLLPSGVRKWCHISIALGLMVDLDIGTEHMRWIGDTRFMIGFLKGVAVNKNFQCRLRMKVVESDKVEMARKAREEVQARQLKVIGGGMTPNGIVKPANDHHLEHDNGAVGSSNGLNVEHGDTDDLMIATNGLKLEDGEEANGASKDQKGLMVEASTEINGNGASHSKSSSLMEPKIELEDGALPDARPLDMDASWLTIESPTKKPTVNIKVFDSMSSGKANEWVDGEGILYVYAGLMPWVARDLMQWPVATSGEGLLDVVVQSIVPRATLLNAITGAEKGEAYWMNCQHYYKVSALTGENLDPENQTTFTLDGEAFPFTSFHVEVHPRLANVLSLDGHFFISEFLQKNHTKE